MSDLEFNVCHQEAMCDEDMPAVFQYFTKVSSLPSRLPSFLPFVWFLFLRVMHFSLGRRRCTRRRREAWTQRTRTGHGSPCRSCGTSSTRGTSSKPKCSCCRKSWPTTRGRLEILWFHLVIISVPMQPLILHLSLFVFTVMRQKMRLWVRLRLPHLSGGLAHARLPSRSRESNACMLFKCLHTHSDASPTVWCSNIYMLFWSLFTKRKHQSNVASDLKVTAPLNQRLTKILKLE